MFQVIEKKILSKTFKIAIIGLGYVGLPMLLNFASNNYYVVGYDKDEEKIKKIKEGKSYISDISDIELEKFNLTNNCVTSNVEELKDVDGFIICVPTPLSSSKEPELKYILVALKEIVENGKDNSLIILESTTYPGTTRNILLPVLEDNGKICGKDFFLAFSPERINPGKNIKSEEIIKVVGGITHKCTHLAKLLYEKGILSKVYEVSTPEVAETCKLLENTYRNVNIALVNQMTMFCNKLGISINEVIDAASTKKFGYEAFYPRAGVGGHCIPIDPYYLSWCAKKKDIHMTMIEQAMIVNEYMPEYILHRCIYLLNEKGLSIRESSVLLVGITYKEDVMDIRESPSISIMKRLLELKAEVCYYDPYVSNINIGECVYYSTDFTLKEKFDLTIIFVNHKKNDYEKIIKNSSLIFDIPNVLQETDEVSIVNL